VTKNEENFLIYYGYLLRRATATISVVSTLLRFPIQLIVDTVRKEYAVSCWGTRESEVFDAIGGRTKIFSFNWN
jgi:hypothetical protein